MYYKEEEAFGLLSYLVLSVKEELTYLGDDMESIWDRLDRKYEDENKLVDLIMNDNMKTFHFVGEVIH